MLALTQSRSSVFTAHLYKTLRCGKAIIEMLHCLTIAKVSSFTVDLSCYVTSRFLKSSPATLQHKKYEIFMTTNEYNDFGLLELRLFTTIYVLCELQNTEILPEMTVL